MVYPYSSSDGFLLCEKDATELEENRFIFCEIDDGKQILLENEIIEVTGTLFDGTWGLGNCKIVSPDTDNINFENNVNSSLLKESSITEPILIEGTVSFIEPIEDFAASSSVLHDDLLFAINYDYSTSIGKVKNEDGTEEIIFFVNEEDEEKISVGDNIAFHSYISYTDATSEAYTDTIRNYYIFD